MKLLSPKACVKIGQWNVRTLFETGKCAQVVKEMQRYGISILGVSEMRWRRPDGQVAKRALEWNPQGKRKRGRPQHTWRRTRMAELERKNPTWNEAKGTAKNRVRWRALVDSLCSTRNEED